MVVNLNAKIIYSGTAVISCVFLTAENAGTVVNYWGIFITLALKPPPSPYGLTLLQGILKGKYHCTIDLLFDWFGLVCFANENKNCQLSCS
jgi:hypothetical protein